MNILLLSPLILLTLISHSLFLFFDEMEGNSTFFILSTIFSSILCVTLIIGTLVKSDWSLMYRLPMSISLLGSLVGTIVTNFSLFPQKKFINEI